MLRLLVMLLLPVLLLPSIMVLLLRTYDDDCWWEDGVCMRLILDSNGLHSDRWYDVPPPCSKYSDESDGDWAPSATTVGDTRSGSELETHCTIAMFVLSALPALFSLDAQSGLLGLCVVVSGGEAAPERYDE